MSKNTMTKIQARISYKNPKNSLSVTMSLKQWLTKKIDFHSIKKASFSEDMLLSVVEFDKDHCIYILLPKDLFQEAKKP